MAATRRLPMKNADGLNVTSAYPYFHRLMLTFYAPPVWSCIDGIKRSDAVFLFEAMNMNTQI